MKKFAPHNLPFQCLQLFPHTISDHTQNTSDFSVVGTWTFFATSHGKSPCDGIGGTLKRLTSDESLRRDPDDAIITANMMADHCRKTFPTISICVITDEDLKASFDLISPRYAVTKTYVGTRSYHYFEHISDGKIGAKILSCDQQFEEKAHHAPVLFDSINKHKMIKHQNL